MPEESAKPITLRIKFESFSYEELSSAFNKISDCATASGSVPSGIVSFPIKCKTLTLLRSPFIHKKHMQKFHIVTHKALLIIKNVNKQTVEKLSSLELNSSVGIKIKAK